MSHNAPTDRRTDRQLVAALERHCPRQRWQLPANEIEREVMRAALDQYREIVLTPKPEPPQGVLEGMEP